jgi:hypothetical protein
MRNRLPIAFLIRLLPAYPDSRSCHRLTEQHVLGSTSHVQGVGAGLALPALLGRSKQRPYVSSIRATPVLRDGRFDRRLVQTRERLPLSYP